VVREGAWERLESLCSERLPEFIPLALEEKAELVWARALMACRDMASFIPPEPSLLPTLLNAREVSKALFSSSSVFRFGAVFEIFFLCSLKMFGLWKGC